MTSKFNGILLLPSYTFSLAFVKVPFPCLFCLKIQDFISFKQKKSGGGPPAPPPPNVTSLAHFTKLKTNISNVFCLEKIPQDVIFIKKLLYVKLFQWQKYFSIILKQNRNWSPLPFLFSTTKSCRTIFMYFTCISFYLFIFVPQLKANALFYSKNILAGIVHVHCHVK